ncbi:universal stress protein [Glycomyces sp. L485]|uniref:universal stress protein n=1 Tax=Glycomyces sp. L485 TaxID=2909235 RepID=UPI001F4B7D93|nr:universal stress protein [Glycomyces sp. L485]MCH7230856.1 universal stress protein [Glycomyces sp. L485]
MPREDSRRERILVGVDGSPSSVRALRWALDQAELTGAKVHALHAWSSPTNWGTKVPLYPGRELADEAHEKLAGIVEEVEAGRGLPEVTFSITEGHPAKVLIDQAEGADLLVLGSRGHGGFVGALLGSVAQHCVHHSRCPVVVVKAGE